MRELACRNKCATVEDIKIANKVLLKAQKLDVKIKYFRLGNWRDLKVLAYTDSSYKNAENTEKSVGGRILFLANKHGQCVLLGWKSKTIQQVCKSVKTAETRSPEFGMVDCILIARMAHEIMSGKRGRQIPVEINIDSQTLKDSIVSSKQVEEKTTRHLIAWIKQQLEEKTVDLITWVPNQEMVADVLTKKNVNTGQVLEILMTGRL